LLQLSVWYIEKDLRLESRQDIIDPVLQWQWQYLMQLLLTWC